MRLDNCPPRQLPLDHLRPRLLCHHGQLPGPYCAWPAQGPLAEAGVFGPTKAEQNWDSTVICSSWPGAIGMLAAGRFIDWVGTKKGYAYSLIGWSFAAIGHAFGHHTWSFGFWRAALGVTEAGNFRPPTRRLPNGSPRGNGRWPRGSTTQAPTSAPSWPLCACLHRRRLGLGGLHLTGIVGLLWLVFWWRGYASPADKLKSGVSQAEARHIHSDLDEQQQSPVRTCLGSSCWAFGRLGPLHWASS